MQNDMSSGISSGRPVRKIGDGRRPKRCRLCPAWSSHALGPGRRVHQYHAEGCALVDGYAPFCKHVFVPNFVGAQVGTRLLGIYGLGRTNELPGFRAEGMQLEPRF